MSKDYGNPKYVDWGHKLAGIDVPELRNREVTFYSKADCGEIHLVPGSCVVVANFKRINGGRGDIAKILHLFQVSDKFYKQDRARAIVQWYSWLDGVPARSLTDDVRIEDPDREIVLDSRPYDSDISLGTISGKCNIVNVPEDMSLSSLMATCPEYHDKTVPTRICRYKLVRKAGKHYVLLPVLDESWTGDDVTKTEMEMPLGRTQAITPQTDRRKSIKNRTVSPIKIVGRNVIRMSGRKPRESFSGSESSNAENESPNKRRSSDDDVSMTPRKKTFRNTSSARRNLNDSLNQSGDSDQLNYSIVNVNEELKLKLRVSMNQKKASNTPNSPRKRSPKDELQTSPRKTRKNSVVPNTPTTSARRSILRTPASKIAADAKTPRRSITLSNVVEEIPSRPARLCTRRQTIGFYHDVTDESPEVPKTPRSSRQVKKPTTPKSASKATSGSTTPSQRMKMLRDGVITPSVGSREGKLKSRKSLLEQARDQLHVSAVPKSLPCRENEFRDIYQFLEGRIKDKCGGCMYISGVPGTGKTATVTEVIRSLQLKLPKFRHIEINGMRLTEPRQAYVHIYRQLQGKTVPWEQAHTFLERRFRNGSGQKEVTVLVVDELDMLCNRRQDVVYNLLDWPSSKEANLVVVTIANTMDLPERLLKGKVTSRLGLTRLTFKPYSFRQLQEIVTSRLVGFDAFNADALQLVARKVAAVSGDARRALDICRRAVEIAENGAKAGLPETVSMGHVEQALGEMMSNPKVQAIKACSRMEQIFLQAVIAESLRTGVEETTFMGVYAQFETICSISGLIAATVSRSLEICARLGAYRLLIGQDSRTDLYQKILLNVSPDDVHYALQEKAQ
uniref:Origin recognition complex subunit 1 n=1 Tax=Phlebotomus papatasi TaxID=29031 RepID=A0A1B0DRD7_PHLPP